MGRKKKRWKKTGFHYNIIDNDGKVYEYTD